MDRKYRIEFKQASKAQQVESQGCNAIIFTNRGAATAVINKEPIETGDSISIAGLQGERDFTTYDVQFTGAGSKALYIKLKFYID